MSEIHPSSPSLFNNCFSFLQNYKENKSQNFNQHIITQTFHKLIYCTDKPSLQITELQSSHNPSDFPQATDKPSLLLQWKKTQIQVLSLFRTITGVMKPLNWWSESYIKVWPFTPGLQTNSEARGVYRLAVDLILPCFRTSSIASLHLRHPKRSKSVRRTTKRSNQSVRRTKTKTSNQPVKRAETKRPYLWEEKRPWD
jgi:hypothetical protein